jgi:hypothetical protein
MPARVNPGASEFPLEYALKDVDLALHAAVRDGHGREDVSTARLILGGPG